MEAVLGVPVVVDIRTAGANLLTSLLTNLWASSSMVRAEDSEMINKIMKYTIYQITNTLNGKIYIGKHQTDDPYDDYYGSGQAIKEAIAKYGKHNFTKTVLFIFDTEEEMTLKEKELITEEFVNRDDTYNLGIGGEGGSHFKGKSHSEDVRQRLSDLNKVRTKAQQEAAKIVGHSSKGRRMSEEAKAKIAEAARKRKMSSETRLKISKSLRNRGQ
jgi:hypothetical protein